MTAWVHKRTLHCTNLVNNRQFIADTLDRGTQSDVTYMDFSKAFNRLDQEIFVKETLNVYSNSIGTAEPLMQSSMDSSLIRFL